MCAPIMHMTRNTILKIYRLRHSISQSDCRTSQTKGSTERGQSLKERLARVRKTDQLKNPEHSYKDRGTIW